MVVIFQIQLNTYSHPSRNITPMGTRTSNLEEPEVVSMEITNLPTGSHGLMVRKINPIYNLWFLGPYNLNIWDTENKKAIGLSYIPHFKG